MNDHDAMEAINKALDRYFRGEITQHTLIGMVSRISGENANAHREAGR